MIDDSHSDAKPCLAVPASRANHVEHLKARAVLRESFKLIWDHSRMFASSVVVMGLLLAVLSATIIPLFAPDPNRTPDIVIRLGFNVFQVLLSILLLRVTVSYAIVLSLSDRAWSTETLVAFCRHSETYRRAVVTLATELLSLVLFFLVVPTVVGPAVVTCRLFVLGPVSSLEERGVLASFRRSWRLTSGHGWMIYRMSILLSFILMIPLAVVVSVAIGTQPVNVVEATALFAVQSLADALMAMMVLVPSRPWTNAFGVERTEGADESTS